MPFPKFGGLLICLWILTGFATMIIDPADPAIFEDEHENKSNPELRFVCATCDSSVRDRTQHCKLCNKCILVYDHHCTWLNTCIGKDNYKYFLVYISSIWFSILLQALLGIGIIIAYGVDMQRLVDRLGQIYGYSTEALGIVWIILIGVITIISGFGLYAVGDIFFHQLYFLYWGVTTYEALNTPRIHQLKLEKAKKKRGKQEIQLP